MAGVAVELLGAIVLGASAGLRIFLAPLALCLLGLGPGWTETPGVSAAAAALLLLELAGDKISGVEQALDAAGLVLRPLWAAAVAVAAAPEDPALAAGAALALALAIGTGKVRLRSEARARLLGEGGARLRAGLSLAEDLLAVGLVLCALRAEALGALGLVLLAVALHLASALLHRRRWRAPEADA